MRILFYLSGEHPTLPYSEIRALLDCYKIEHKIIEQLDQTLLIEIQKLNEITQKTANRSAMLHKILNFYCKAPADLQSIKENVIKSELFKEIKNKSFCSRAKRIKGYCRNLVTIDVEKTIADAIFASAIENKQSIRVNLEHPDVEVYSVLTNDQCLTGITLANVDRIQFEKRKAHKRPFFSPISLMPKVARTMVNLARIKENEVLLDAFCGTGGILIEAGLMGIKIIGADIDPKMVAGTETNLKFFGINVFRLLQADARKLRVEKVDAIVTDPPYGRAAATFKVKLNKLYEESLENFHNILKPNKYLCITAPIEMNIIEIANKFGFEVVEQHFERLHKSLMRTITVFKNVG